MTSKIYKVQIDSTGRNILVYNADRSNSFQGPVDSETVKHLGMGPFSKKYMLGTIREDGMLGLDPVNEFTAEEAGF